MPPGASSQVDAAASAAAAPTATAASKKRARDTATVEEADSDAAQAHSSSEEERPTRRARGDSGHNESDTVPSPVAVAAADPPAAHPLGDPLLAPVRRFDPDSLSLVFAMLNTADFLAAIRVCKGWHTTRMKHTAWPKFHLPSFIQSLRDDDYDNPARRRLGVSLVHKLQSRLDELLAGTTAEFAGGAEVDAPSVDADGASSSSTAAAVAATGPAASPPPPSASASMWRHAASLKLLVRGGSFPSFRVQEAACDRALQQIAQLPYLSALSVHDLDISDAAARDFFSAVASRLQALLLFGDWSNRAHLAHLPLLRGLRVLVLNQQPPLPGLAQLTQLRYLHFPHWSNAALDEPLTRTLRWLSQAHQLRSLSIDANHPIALVDCGLLFQPPVATEEGATHAPPAAAAAASSSATPSLTPIEAPGSGGGVPAADWSRPCCLTDVSILGGVSVRDLDWLGRLPHLRRLRVESRQLSSRVRHTQPPTPVAVLDRLQQLRLCLQRDPTTRWSEAALPLDWRHLRVASQLRVLQLTSLHVEEVPAATLLAVVDACAASLEELRLGDSIRIKHAAEEEQHSASAFASASVSAADLPAVAASPASAAASASAASAADAVGGAAPVAADSDADAAGSPAAAAALAPLGPWSALSRCLRLRVLQLELQSGTAGSGVLAALSLLPAFQSLELTLRGKQRDGWPAHGLVLPPALLRGIAQSRSWCSLHVHSAAGQALDLLRTAGGLAAQMPVEAADDATARRLRVYSHGKGGGGVRSYGIRDDGRGGGRQWQLL